MAISPKRSFNGWDLLEYIKGRKKSIFAAIGIGLSYFLTDNAVITLITSLSALGFEGSMSIAEFYFKRIKLDKE